jgi:hypothetical protein
MILRSRRLVGERDLVALTKLDCAKGSYRTGNREHITDIVEKVLSRSGSRQGAAITVERKFRRLTTGDKSGVVRSAPDQLRYFLEIMNAHRSTFVADLDPGSSRRFFTES